MSTIMRLEEDKKRSTKDNFASDRTRLCLVPRRMICQVGVCGEAEPIAYRVEQSHPGANRRTGPMKLAIHLWGNH